MMCPPKAWFLLQNGQNLGALGGTWVAANLKGGASLAAKNVELGFLEPFPLLGDSLSGQGMEREKDRNWAFQDK